MIESVHGDDREGGRAGGRKGGSARWAWRREMEADVDDDDDLMITSTGDPIGRW